VELQSVGATDQFVSQYDPATGALLPVEKGRGFRQAGDD
jgi:hypothetical protein